MVKPAGASATKTAENPPDQRRAHERSIGSIRPESRRKDERAVHSVSTSRRRHRCSAEQDGFHPAAFH